NWALFAANPRIRHLAIDYGRGGTLEERLAAWPRLRALVDQPGSIVVDPDSRLTQLGLLPVCPEDSYYFFESRAYGAGTDESLSHLASRWASETFDVEEPRAWIAPEDAGLSPEIALSFGVGENAEKRVRDPFEVNLLKALVERTGSILLDKGAGGEEAARVERAICQAGSVGVWEGDYAPFASAISRSKLYIGYDSAGQHVAAACGIPLVSVFAGSVSERMFQRWKPTGRGAIGIVRVTKDDPQEVLQRTLRAAGHLRASQRLG
ncbi:MAG: glycosyltransferase family 9 protein, partial [Bryobacteraceae bacterium]